MSNDLIKHKSWLQLHWKWMLPTSVIFILAFILLLSLTSGHLDDYGQAYSDPRLFEGALEKAKQNEDVKIALGNIASVSKMAILEGDVTYTNQNRNVQFTVKIEGIKGKASMDVIAERKDIWVYKKITIRIKNPPDRRQIIMVK